MTLNSDKKISPCPCCGGESELVIFEKPDDTQKLSVYLSHGMFIRCTKCMVRTSRVLFNWWEKDKIEELKDQFINTWNTRPTHVKAHLLIDEKGCRCSNCNTRFAKSITQSLDMKFCPDCGAEF